MLYFYHAVQFTLNIIKGRDLKMPAKKAPVKKAAKKAPAKKAAKKAPAKKKK